MALRDYLPAAVAERQMIANGFSPSSGDSVYDYILAITGSEEEAEAERLRFRTTQAEAGEQVT